MGAGVDDIPLLLRLKFLKIIFIFTFIAVTARLFYWQVISFDKLSALAEQQHFVQISLNAPRGRILSSDNSVLASNEPTYLLYAMPQAIKNIKDKPSVMKDKPSVMKSEVVKKLAAVLIPSELEGDEKIKAYDNLVGDLTKRLDENLGWVQLNKNINIATKKRIEDLKLEGIGFENQLSRFYPEASMAAHLLGFVGSDTYGKQIGYFGVEGFYNGELKGVSGTMAEEKDARGLPILIGKFFKREPKSGHGLILHVDRTVQFIAEKKLKEGVKKYGAKSGSVIIMDPKTGAILAMASIPNYDPNNFSQFPKEHFKNPIVADSYEPGSIFKVLVAAAAINENLIKPDTICDICSGPVEIGGYTIRTWNNKYYPNSSILDVIIHSDNTGMVFIGRKLGVDKLYEYIDKFGFGNTTAVDLQDETTPQVRAKEQWKEIDLATASFGQGVAVTAMQMVKAISGIANKGILMEPHVVKYIDGERLIEIKPKVVGQPITELTAKLVTEMMVEAVDKGEARVFKPKGFKVAGKTGTAQIPVQGHYDPNKTIASFVGFAPADDPKFVMLVRYSEPSSSIFGAETAAPTFFEIAKELFTYFNIAPAN